MLKIEGAVATHAGRAVRSGTRTNYYLFGNYRYDTGIRQKREYKTIPAQQMAAAVYDGMGGEEAGEVGFSAGSERMYALYNRGNKKRPSAARYILPTRRSAEKMKRRGGGRMGTTVAALYVDADTAVCCNVGDSLRYFMREVHCGSYLWMTVRPGQWWK